MATRVLPLGGGVFSSAENSRSALLDVERGVDPDVALDHAEMSGYVLGVVPVLLVPLLQDARRAGR